MEKLADKLKQRMEMEDLSLSAAAKQIGVSHSTIDRIIRGETVEIDTLIKISEYLNTPVEEFLGDAKVTSERMERIANLFSMEPELADVMDKISKGIKTGEIDKKIITEIAAFIAFRLNHYSL